MELKDYWRMLRRRRHIIYWTVALVAVLSVILVGFSAFSAFDVSQMSIEVNQEAPTPAQLAQQVHNLTTIPWDPVSESSVLSVDVVNNAFTATDRRTFFQAVATSLRTKYGIQKSWLDIQAALDVYPAARNHIFFKVIGSPVDDATNLKIVQTAAQWVLNYVNNDYHKLYPNEAAPHAYVFDPLYLEKAAHLTQQISGLVLRIVGGVVLGIVLAFLWEYLDDYTHDERDVERLLGTRTLSMIPVGTGRGSRAS